MSPRGPGRLAALLERREALQRRSQDLRTQLADDWHGAQAGWTQGLGLWRIALAAAGIGTAWVTLRRRGGRRRLAGALRLLPLAWGLWRAVRAARQRPVP